MKIFGVAQNRIARVLGVVGIAVLAFASASLADAPVSVQLTGVGNGLNGAGQGTIVDSSVYGGLYVDPYFGTVSGLGTNVPIICDDWSNNTFMNETWTASVTNAANVAGGSTMFGSNPTNPQAQQLYNAATYLAAEIMSSYNSQNYTAEVEYSFALWELTYGTTYGSNGNSTEIPSPTAFLATTSYAGDQGIVTGDINSAIAAVTNTGYSASAWEILTPTGAGSPEGTVPQEFLVETPEPSALLMLGLGLGAMLLMWRRRRNAGASPMMAA